MGSALNVPYHVLFQVSWSLCFLGFDEVQTHMKSEDVGEREREKQPAAEDRFFAYWSGLDLICTEQYYEV